MKSDLVLYWEPAETGVQEERLRLTRYSGSDWLKQMDQHAMQTNSQALRKDFLKDKNDSHIDPYKKFKLKKKKRETKICKHLP